MPTIRLIILAIVLATLGACHKESHVYLRKIYIAHHSTRMKIGDRATLEVKCYPDDTTAGLPDDTVRWSSTRPHVVSIDQQGHIEALAIGVSTITAQWGDFKAQTVITIDTTLAFADDAFMTYCLAHFDDNGDGILQALEVNDVVGLDLTDLQKAARPVSLDGIEMFASLEKLKISHLTISHLDLSRNTKLRDIDCSMCNIATLDLRANRQIEMIDCHGSESLTQLLLGSRDELGTNSLNILNCCNCSLTSLDLSRSDRLEYLDCRNNQLTNLDLSNNNLLRQLSCSGNNIQSITVWPDFEPEHLKTLDIDAGTTLVPKQ